MNATTARQRCSSIARNLDEPLYGTAPTSPAWVLLEQPGAWGPDALAESALDSRVAAELNRRSKVHGFRILLIRGSARKPPSRPRSGFLVRSAQAGTWMERLEIESPADLLDIDPGTLSKPDSPRLGEPLTSLWAVCTHGRRDPCCAEFGRRLLRSFEAHGGTYGLNLWESSHQGGHRFAANLALFPQGLFYGRVDPDDAGRIINAHGDGRIILDGYRGRSAFDQVTQAADYMVRREIGLTGIDDLVPLRRQDFGENRHSVTFKGVMGALTITVETADGPMRPESCNKPKLTPVKVFRQINLTSNVGESPSC